MTDLYITWGETQSYSIAVDLPEGTTLAGHTLVFTARNGSRRIQKTSTAGGIVVDNAATGAATLTIDRADTITAPNPTRREQPAPWLYDLWLDEERIAYGTLWVSQAITTDV